MLFADVVDSVRIVQADPEGAVRRWREFAAAAVSEDIASRGGRVVKTTGDGMLAEFGSATDAVEAALAMQDRASNAATPASNRNCGSICASASTSPK